jgi:hypothetical protein
MRTLKSGGKSKAQSLKSKALHEARIIPLDGRPHAGAGIRMYMGDSRGRFEDDTLVVETTNFTDRTAIGPNGGGAIHSQALRLVERFTTPKLSILRMRLPRRNYGLANILSAARAEER